MHGWCSTTSYLEKCKLLQYNVTFDIVVHWDIKNVQNRQHIFLELRCKKGTLNDFFPFKKSLVKSFSFIPVQKDPKYLGQFLHFDVFSFLLSKFFRHLQLEYPTLNLWTWPPTITNLPMMMPSYWLMILLAPQHGPCWGPMSKQQTTAIMEPIQWSVCLLTFHLRTQIVIRQSHLPYWVHLQNAKGENLLHYMHTDLSHPGEKLAKTHPILKRSFEVFDAKEKLL